MTTASVVSIDRPSDFSSDPTAGDYHGCNGKAFNIGPFLATERAQRGPGAGIASAIGQEWPLWG